MKKLYSSLFMLCLLVMTFNEIYKQIFSSSRLPNFIVQFNRSFAQEAKHREEAKLSCLVSPWNLTGPVHPNAAVYSLPKPGNLLSPNFTFYNICQNTKANDNQKVLMIFTRVGDFAKRNTVRQTYLEDIKNSSNKLNYVTFFSLAIPPESMRAKIEAEQIMYNDVVIFNNKEGYELTTFKLLTGMKFATCCCPNAKYFMKADVDAYLRIKKVDSYLNDLQKIADNEKPLHRIDGFYGNSWESHVPIYSGGICAYLNPQRSPNPHAISWEALPGKRFPFKFCFGHLEIYSMTLLKLLVEYCPRHCYGDYNHSIPLNVSRPCESQWEDIFMGSCVYSYFKNEVFLESIHRLGKIGDTYAQPNLEKLKSSTPEMLNRHVMSAQVGNANRFRELHNFFQMIDNGIQRNKTGNATKYP